MIKLWSALRLLVLIVDLASQEAGAMSDHHDQNNQFAHFLAPAPIPGGHTVVHRIRITSRTEVLSLLGFS
jgi:hypothetical protein